MLRSMQVRNFAIIDEIEIDFDAGTTVLTGETGAGKSILVDALGLVLGERGGSGLVRDGAKRAEFSAEFDIAGQPAARAWLHEQALDMDDECLLRRVIGADGRSRAFINGNAVSLQSLKALGELLADIHGQHFHQSLGKRDVQRALLDHFGGLLQVGAETAEAFHAWRTLADRLAELRAGEHDRESRLELLEFQVNELDALDLDPDELESLLAERQKLQNVNRIAEGLSEVLRDADDGQGETVQSLIAGTCQSLQVLGSYDESLEPARQLFDEASILISEGIDQLRRYSDALDADPARRDWVDDRLHAIQDVARKHRVETGQLGEVQSRLRAQLDELRNLGQRSSDLEASVTEAEERYFELARSLSEGRRNAASQFSGEVTAAMSGLGMPDGTFFVEVEPRDAADARAFGIDSIDYKISANAGQAPMPLSKVASGGELSRMSLSIQVIASDGSQIPTMVFDEVDSGVGGGVAEMVGRRLQELGGERQVLCVTHLPQVASQADHHVRINKISDGKSTRSGLSHLNDNERIEELARMLGGVKITKKTREHAAEMLATGRRPAGKRARAAR